MKNNIMSTMTSSLNRFGFQIKKASPEILIVAGVIGTVASAVMACRASTKVHEVLDETKETIDVIHKTAEEAKENPEKAEVYSEKDYKKDLAIAYGHTAVKLVKLYAPSVTLGALSLGCVLTSNNILRQRNAALAAAYTAVDKSFKDYRNNVVERFGKEMDRELRYNIKAKELDETVVDENGNEQVVKKTVNVVNIDDASGYARYFDKRSSHYEDNPEYNMMFLKAQERYANDLLRSKRYLFLNDVYEMLDIPRSEEGQCVGWIYDEENPVGDNYVDFGIFNAHREINRDFVNGYEPVILLDFNVDGNIMKRFRNVDRRRK